MSFILSFLGSSARQYILYAIGGFLVLFGVWWVFDSYTDLKTENEILHSNVTTLKAALEDQKVATAKAQQQRQIDLKIYEELQKENRKLSVSYKELKDEIEKSSNEILQCGNFDAFFSGLRKQRASE